MAENLSRKPKRGILKSSTSFEHRDLSGNHSNENKNPHFDESNIAATLHPPDKDYGFMKIDEPKTPYEYASSQEDDDDGEEKPAQHEDLNPNVLAARIAMEAAASEPGKEGKAENERARRLSEPSGDEEDLQLLTPEEREKRRKFEQKRKAHYNEFYAVKMARQLMDEEEENGSNAKPEGDGKTKDLEVEKDTSALCLADTSNSTDAMDTAAAGN